MTDKYTSIIKSIANLDNLKKKLLAQAPDVQLYEDWERELLELGTELGSAQALNLIEKVKYDREYTEQYNEYKAGKEKVTDAETKRAVDFMLLEKETMYKTDEALLIGYQKQYDTYRRYAENVLKWRIIREQADMRRAEMATRNADNPFN